MDGIIIEKIKDIAMDPNLDEDEKEAEVADLLDEEGVDVEDVHQALDEEDLEPEDDGFLLSPEEAADIDDEN
jgi:hypothetical protein